MANLIDMKDVTKSYRGALALEGVNFSLAVGEVHALLGENGAGKSTLTKILAGTVQPTSGALFWEGKPITFSTPSAALETGIAMVFQETNLVPSMSVAENLFLGNEGFFNRLRGVYIAAQQFLQSMNFDVDPWSNVSSLGAAKKQMVEIAKAVLQEAKVIIFDEPTASLTPEEKHHFFSLVARLKLDGISVIFISHAIEEALQIADKITILRDGGVVASDDSSAFDRDSIIQHMVGRSLSDELYAERHAIRKAGRKVLSVEGVSKGQLVRNNSFSIYEGQICGMFGLIGSGRTETARIIAGIDKRNYLNGGEIKLDGKHIRYRVPRPATKDGIGYITEDRKQEGFFETMSIDDNVFMGLMAADRYKSLLVKQSDIQIFAKTWKENLNIRAVSDSARVIELSGGNQQKVVIASTLIQKPQVIIFDEPTRGVDVGAIAEIHRLIRELADAGLAVVVISSYLPEIMNLSDRILVSRLGRIVEEFSPDEATEEKILFATVH